jgi:ligand-binding sensor protein
MFYFMGEKRVFICGHAECDQNKFEEEIPEMADVGLAGIIDIETAQSVMDVFYKLTHFPIGLNDIRGMTPVNAGWQDICTKFHRAHPETSKHCAENDTKLTSSILPGEIELYRYKNNMRDITTPSMMSGQLISYIFSGQFFFDEEPLDISFSVLKLENTALMRRNT